MMDAVKAIFKAYFTAELIRSSGLVYGIMSMTLWIILFLAPLALFAPPDMDKGVMAGYAFTAVLVFMSYGMASWDLAWEIRWLMRTNILEYYIASGRSIFLLYAGVIPVSLMWLGMSLASVYIVLSLLMAQPVFIVSDPLMLAYGLLLLGIVLFAHALILAGSILSIGTSGPVMEIISWVLPIATGGLVPLVRLPTPAARLALLTPYSYPAELIRAYLLGAPTFLPIGETIMYGTIYGFVYLAVALWYFETQYKKVIREGIKTVGMY